MKHYLVYKKQFSLVISFIFLGALFAVPLSFSYGQNAQDLQGKIDQRNTDINKLELEIQQYQTQLDGLGKQKSSLNVSLSQLDLTRKKLIANISVTQNKIENINLKIIGLSRDITGKQCSINTDTDAIKLDFRKINEFENNSEIATLLSQDSFTAIWNDI